MKLIKIYDGEKYPYIHINEPDIDDVLGDLHVYEVDEEMYAHLEFLKDTRELIDSQIRETFKKIKGE